MQQIKKLSQLRNLPPTKKLKYYKVIYFGSIFILSLMNLLSLGITGSNFMIWRTLQTDVSQQMMQQQYSGFYKSQQMIIAFDVLCLFMLGLLTFSVFKFYTKGNAIITSFIAAFWLIRWASAIYYLSTAGQLRNDNKKKLNIMYQPNGQLNPLCLSEQCTGQLLNYVECGKIQLWKRLDSFSIGYLVITILVAAVTLIAAYKTNKLDVQNEQETVELAESR